MAIGIGLHCWHCEHGPCSGECRKDHTKSVQEIRDDKIKSILEEQQRPTWDDVRKAIQIAKDSMGVDNDGETCYSHLSTEQIIEQLKQGKKWDQ